MLGLAVLSAFAIAPAAARILPVDYRYVGVSVPEGAAAPLDTVVVDESGKPQTLHAFVTHPTVLVFADYTCRTLCGPILDFVGAALKQSGLDIADRYRLVVIGIDPKDTTTDAAAMRHASLDPTLDKVATFLTADAKAVAALTSALGYRFKYDAEDDIYVHPAAAYVLTADGKVARVLTGLGLSGADMRLALVEAGQGKIGTLGDRVRLLCSAFDPVHGQYNAAVSRLLAIAGGATVLALSGGIGLLALAARRRAG
jgi:protein SCO1/2